MLYVGFSASTLLATRPTQRFFEKLYLAVQSVVAFLYLLDEIRQKSWSVMSVGYRQKVSFAPQGDTVAWCHGWSEHGLTPGSHFSHELSTLSSLHTGSSVLSSDTWLTDETHSRLGCRGCLLHVDPLHVIRHLTIWAPHIQVPKNTSLDHLLLPGNGAVARGKLLEELCVGFIKNHTLDCGKGTHVLYVLGIDSPRVWDERRDQHPCEET